MCQSRNRYDWESEIEAFQEEWNEIDRVSLLRTEEKRQMLSTVLCQKLGINKCNLYFGEFPVQTKPHDGGSETCRRKGRWLMIGMRARTKMMFLSTLSVCTILVFAWVRCLWNSILVCKQNLNFGPWRHQEDTLWRHSIHPPFAVVPSCRLNENMTLSNLHTLATLSRDFSPSFGRSLRLLTRVYWIINFVTPLFRRTFQYWWCSCTRGKSAWIWRSIRAWVMFITVSVR